jgi:hypothetical protein
MNGETWRGGWVRTSRRRGEGRRNESTWSAERPGGRLVRELANGVGDPAPQGLAVVILPRGEFVGARGAFLNGLVAVPLEHELRRPPNVDLGYQSKRLMKSPPGPPMTLGNAAASRVRLIVWCRACNHQVEPDPAEMARQYGAGTSFLDWRERLVCSRCGSRAIDMVVTGTERRER